SDPQATVKLVASTNVPSVPSRGEIRRLTDTWFCLFSRVKNDMGGPSLVADAPRDSPIQMLCRASELDRTAPINSAMEFQTLARSAYPFRARSQRYSFRGMCD